MSYLKHKPGSIEEIMANQNQKLNDNAYQDMFKKELDKAGTGIGSMSPKEKKDFFNKIDDKYKAKNEELHPKDVPHLKKMVKDGASDEDIKKMHPRITDYELEKLKESIIDPKGIKEEDAYENDRYIIKNGKATLDNSNTPDKKNHVYADGHKDAEKKAKAKGIKEESDEGKSSDEKKETHTFMTKDMNQKQKNAKGEKEVVTKEDLDEKITEPNGTISQKNKDLLKVNNYITVKGKVYVIDKVSLVSGVYTMKASDKNGKIHTISSKDVDSVEYWKASLKVASYNPKPKMSFKEAYKKVKENQTTTDDSTQDRANQGDSLDDNSKDPDIKKPKGKADTGSKPTPVDTSPEIEYKN